MTALVLDAAEVRRLLPMDRCMDLVADALRTLAGGDALNPLRWGVRLPEPMGLIGMMPGWLGAPQALGIKVVAVFPKNHGTRWDAHQGVVILFDPENGVPTAILEASAITAVRTAAASGVATRALGREDAGDLALLGSGVQARTHLEAMALARDLRRVRVFSPRAERREALAAWARTDLGLAAEACGSAREAVEGADLVCTTTSAREPVLEGAWLAAGAHVNAVGACVAAARELDSEAVRRARLFVDRRESALAESGDLLFPVEEGVIDAAHVVGELGDVLLGRVPGRESAEDVTLFESLGLAVEDLAAAHHVLERAREEGVGTPVELEGLQA